MRNLNFILLILTLCCSCAYMSRSSSEYKVNKSKWEKAKVTTYSLVESMSCECISNKDVISLQVTDSNSKKATLISEIPAQDAKIINGKPDKILFASGSNLPQEYLYGALSVEDLFNIIEKAILSNARSIDVKYNSKYGYPESVSINYSKYTQDEEFHYEIHEFKK